MLELSAQDSLLLAIGSIIGGMILLIRGGNWTIDSAAHIARKFGISPMIIGFTVVAFGTSLPELVVSVLANLEGSPGIAVGNVLGSNIANILFVAGVTSVFAVLTVNRKAVAKDLAFMMLATLILLALLLSGFIGLMAGIGMVAILLVYVFFQYLLTIRGIRPAAGEDEEENASAYAHPVLPYLLLLVGLLFIAAGAEFLVRGAKLSASIIGVPDAVIALSIIALGTSLPELSTSITAGRKGHSDIVIGNIVGSNVFNILMIMGLTAIIKPIDSRDLAPQLLSFDIWLTLGVSALFAAILLIRKKLARPAGLIFVTAYVAYNLYIYAIYMTAP